MKRVYLAFALLAVCIGLCAFEQYTVETTYREATDMINQAVEYTDSGDFASAERVCAQLSDYWQEKYSTLSAMIDHGMLDEAGTTIYALEDCAREESDDLHSELITAKGQLKAVRENQKITPGNIF